MLNGERLLERAIRTAQEAGLAPILVVLGANASAIQTACRLADAEVVVNSSWGEGMGSSVRAGIAALPEDVRALLLLTCDQPAVGAQHLRSLIDAGAYGEAVGSSYAGKVGVPAYFPATYFPRLSELQGDAGARSLLLTAQSIELPGGELDIDTQAALEEARARFTNRV